MNLMEKWALLKFTRRQCPVLVSNFDVWSMSKTSVIPAQARPLRNSDVWLES